MITAAWLLPGALVFACVAGARLLVTTRDARGRRRRSLPVATLVLLVVVAVPSLLQFYFPALLPSLMRDAALIRQGQWWRVVTAIVVQDGGVPGTVFNLVGLSVVGSIAEWMEGPRRWLVILIVVVVLAEGCAIVWQPLGAGNSIVNFGFAGSVCSVCLARSRDRTILPWAVLALGMYAALIIVHEIHGVAALVGATVGGVFMIKDSLRAR